MSAVAEGSSKCGQRAALSLFFFLELIAYILSSVALISPSWQYVYLENGRTEHHHGLWLDCKRDYTHDYGRSREFYETLYRLDKQQSPLDQFFLTSLLCVYKFDYYIDTEDLYDHNHDENRLQDDANQHLLLGWKLASLAALGFAVLAAGAALLLSVCAFCHRTLICASAVLVTVAALLSSMGLIIFYIWANYQDNNIIKEEDGIYEQYFGWAFYMQIVGTVMHFMASFMGCIVTSVAFRKNRTKLVKIEVIDGDNSTLLNRPPSQPFKRSLSAIYKIDSTALMRWEKDFVNFVESKGSSERNNFKRASSVPNFKKYTKKSKHSLHGDKIIKSISNLSTISDHCNFSGTSEKYSPTAKLWRIPVSPNRKSILKTSSKQISAMSNISGGFNDDPDMTYEYLPYDCTNKSQSTETISKSFTATAFVDGDQNKHVSNIATTLSHRVYPETSINVYDKVYEHIPEKPLDYDQPNSRHMRNTVTNTEPFMSNSKGTGRSTLIDDVPNQLQDSNTTVIHNLLATLVLPQQNPEAKIVPEESLSFISSYGDIAVSSDDILLARKCDLNNTMMKTCGEMQPSSATSNLRDFNAEEGGSSCFPVKHLLNSASVDVAINIFDTETVATKESQRSIRNLVSNSNKQETINAFERSDASEHSSINGCFSIGCKKTDSVMKSVLPRSAELRTACGFISTPYRNVSRCIGDEMDRSLGSAVENDTDFEHSNRQHTEVELCLNLFMNGEVAPLAAVDVGKSDSKLFEDRDGNMTTV